MVTVIERPVLSWYTVGDQEIISNTIFRQYGVAFIDSSWQYEAHVAATKKNSTLRGKILRAGV